MTPLLAGAPQAIIREFSQQRAQRGRYGGGGGGVDSFFTNTVLLLHGDGTNGAQNNTFTDSSTNNFTITRNGNTTQGTFSPFGSNWSAKFDGTGDYLSLASSTDFDFGTGDFTIEAFVYPSTTQVQFSNIVCQASTGNAWYFSFSTSNFLTFSNHSTNYITSSSALSTGVWSHVAVSRNGTSLKMYINGIEVGSATNSISLGVTANVNIGFNGVSHYFNGYISNLRILKGTALYTSNFTPPTSPLTAITNTSLLACHVNRFIDGSTNAFAITRNGDVSVERFTPFAPADAYSTTNIGGSGYFDGTGDYLTIADNAALDMGSSNFTIEGWYYPQGDSNHSKALLSKRPDSSQVGGILVYYGAVGLTPSLLVDIGGNWSINIQSTIAFGSYQWNHFAVVRNGTNFRLYINGAVGVNTTNSGSIPDNSHAFGIGTMGANGSGPIEKCYISNFRVVKGTAVYTAAFTPPTSPLTAITNTSLLCNFTNGGIIDNAMINNLETVGNAQISTSIKKYGTGSIYFDGTGDYLLAPSSPNWDFGTGDFTVEFWINFSSVGSDTVIGKWGSGAGKYAWVVQLDSSNLSFYSGNNGSLSTQYTFSWSVTTSTWYHVAVTRSGTSLRAFLDGTQIGTTQTSTQSLSATGSFCCIGENLDLGGQSAFVHGYIDDLRITKGVARYTANFTPPTAAFSDN